MKEAPNRRPRIDRIREALVSLGPATVRKISDETGIVDKDVALIIRTSRKQNWSGPRIRKAGKTKTGGCTRAWLYEVSEEPDEVVAPLRNQPSRQKRVKNPRKTSEQIADGKRLKKLSEQTKPFRDPMIWATAGRQA